MSEIQDLIKFKPSSALEIVKNPKLIEGIQGKYSFIMDSGPLAPFNLSCVINWLAKKGWKCVSITTFEHGIPEMMLLGYTALMERL